MHLPQNGTIGFDPQPVEPTQGKPVGWPVAFAMHVPHRGLTRGVIPEGAPRTHLSAHPCTRGSGQGSQKDSQGGICQVGFLVRMAGFNVSRSPKFLTSTWLSTGQTCWKDRASGVVSGNVGRFRRFCLKPPEFRTRFDVPCCGFCDSASDCRSTDRRHIWDSMLFPVSRVRASCMILFANVCITIGGWTLGCNTYLRF